MKAFVDTMDYGRRISYIVQNDELERAINERMELLIVGKKGAKETCEAIKSKVDKLLADWCR